MSDSQYREEFFFAWEGADHPNGPWGHLRVLEFRGEEYVSRPYCFAVDLFHDGQGADVAVRDLIGAKAALKWHTRTTPTHRIVHGIITSAEELAETSGQRTARYRVSLMPPFWRAAMMCKSAIYLDKTLRQIIEQVLERTSLGAALRKSEAARPLVPSDGFDNYTTPNLSWVRLFSGTITQPFAGALFADGIASRRPSHRWC